MQWPVRGNVGYTGIRPSENRILEVVFSKSVSWKLQKSSQKKDCITFKHYF
jgi:hypothetical protein